MCAFLGLCVVNATYLLIWFRSIWTRYTRITHSLNTRHQEGLELLRHVWSCCTMAFTTNLWYDLGEYLISGTIAQVETVQH